MPDERLIITAADLGVAPEPGAAGSSASRAAALPPVRPPSPRALIDLDGPPSDQSSPQVPDQGPAAPPQSPSLPGTLAPLGERVLAACLDGFALVVGLALAMVATGGLLPAVLVVVVAVCSIIMAAPMARSGERSGQTFGMQIVGIRKVRIDGSAFSPGYAQAWYWGPAVLFSLVGVGGLANVLAPLLNERRQSLRDLMMRTQTFKA